MVSSCHTNSGVIFYLVSPTDPSAITSLLPNAVVVEGNSISLHCNTTGNPAPNVTWTKDGSSTVLYQRESFTINNITRQQAGQYICTVDNGIGSKVNASVAVIVHCEWCVYMA